MFGFIKKGLKSIGKAVKAVNHLPVFKQIGQAAAIVSPVNVLKRVPVVGPLVKSVHNIANMPMTMTGQILDGQRIDKVALNGLKNTLKEVKTVAPYVQTVISLVPGVGQGISGALGASLALASGASISDAMIAGLKGALPGGPVAAAAFEVAKGVLKGDRIDTIAVHALPIPEASKQALIKGLDVAKDLAAGKRVDKVILDNAVKALPPDIQKAVQIGTAIGNAARLQEHAGKAQAIEHTVTATDHVIAALKDPKHRTDAAKVVKTTQALAKAGDKGAKAAVVIMKKRAAAHQFHAGVNVHPQTGRIISKRTGKPLSYAVAH